MCKILKPTLYALVGLIGLFGFHASRLHAQDACPRIWRSGDTLWTDPADAYQWFKDGVAIAGANARYVVPQSSEGGRYTVVASGINIAYRYDGVDVPAWTLQVQVLDRSYRPIAGARVSLQDQEAVSDEGGVARFSFMSHSASRHVVRARHDRYLQGISAHWPTAGRHQHVVLHLTPRETTHQLNASLGGTVSQGALTLTLPPNGVADAAGNRYTGTVALSIDHGRPGDVDFGFRMPGGDFMALDAQGRERFLLSYGYVTVELHGSSGQPLNVAPGQTAEIRLAIPPAQRSTAPQRMPVWHFDTEAAIWKEAGEFQRVGNAYVGRVQHFSSWNCDIPSDRCTVKGRIFDCLGQLLSGGRVQVGQRLVLTDSEGNYQSFVPAELRFDVRTESTESEQGQEVGPFPAETTNDLADLRSVDFWGYGVVSAQGQLSVMGNDLRLIDRISFDTGQDIRPGASMPVDFGNRPERGTLHGVNGCEAGIRIYYAPVNGNCLLLDTTDLKRETLFRDFNALLNAQTPIHRLNLRQGNWSAAQLAQVPQLAPCIQELNAAVGTHPEFWAMLGQLTSLQDLNIERNNLRTLPDQLANLTNLIVLDVEHNRFTEVPPVLEQMSFLRNIKLEGNPITDLPAWFYDFPQLESLDLSLTNITRFPDDIGKLADTLRALGLYGLRLAPGEQERLRQLLPTTQFFF